MSFLLHARNCCGARNATRNKACKVLALEDLRFSLRSQIRNKYASEQIKEFLLVLNSTKKKKIYRKYYSRGNS